MKKLFIAAWLLSASLFGAAQAAVTAGPRFLKYNTAGTYSWVAPAGVYLVDIILCSGQGGGGGSGNSTTSNGGGGADSVFATRFGVTPGSAYTVTVGAGGTPGTAGGASVAGGLGGIGAASSFGMMISDVGTGGSGGGATAAAHAAQALVVFGGMYDANGGLILGVVSKTGNIHPLCTSIVAASTATGAGGGTLPAYAGNAGAVLISW